MCVLCQEKLEWQELILTNVPITAIGANLRLGHLGQPFFFLKKIYLFSFEENLSSFFTRGCCLVGVAMFQSMKSFQSQKSDQSVSKEFSFEKIYLFFI